jgi:hypothetical protein
MRIACIGWGSLIWNPKDLLIQGDWQTDGPFLPLEYIRKSNNGRLTLVITESAKPVQTLWVLMATDNLETAITSLLEREEIPEKKKTILIGSIKVEEETIDNIKLKIKSWAINLKLDAVIWTNLPPKFPDTPGQILTVDKAIEYLYSIEVDKKRLAEEYIRRTPKQIDTEFRRRFEAEFGWSYSYEQ